MAVCEDSAPTNAGHADAQARLAGGFPLPGSAARRYRRDVTPSIGVAYNKVTLIGGPRRAAIARDLDDMMPWAMFPRTD